MNAELFKIIEDCVKYALDEMGDDVHELSLFCTLEQSQSEQEKAA